MSEAYKEFSRLMLKEMKKAYSKKTFDHVTHPRNIGGFDDATGYGEASEPKGDTVKIWLKIEDNVITKAGFFTGGCTTLIAVGSALTEMVKGKSVSEAQEMTPEKLIDYLGGIPPKTEHCAEMAVSALSEAVMLHFVNELTKSAGNKQGFRHLRLEL